MSYPLDDKGSDNVAWQLQAQAEMARDYRARTGSASPAVTDLEKRLRADKDQVLAEWNARRTRRQNAPLGQRQCRECGRTVEVEEDNLLAPHFRQSGMEICEGTACSCPEDIRSMVNGALHINVNIDGDCLVHGIDGSKTRGNEQA